MRNVILVSYLMKGKSQLHLHVVEDENWICSLNNVAIWTECPYGKVNTSEQDNVIISSNNQKWLSKVKVTNHPLWMWNTRGNHHIIPKNKFMIMNFYGLWFSCCSHLKRHNSNLRRRNLYCAACFLSTTEPEEDETRLLRSSLKMSSVKQK